MMDTIYCVCRTTEHITEHIGMAVSVPDDLRGSLTHSVMKGGSVHWERA
jgi:hypothetical protein